MDPLQYYVLPRIVAFAVSVALLSLFFDAVVLGALSISRARAGGAGGARARLGCRSGRLSASPRTWTGQPQGH